MSWLGAGDDRLLKAMQNRREVKRGPVTDSASPYVDEALGEARAAAYTFATNLVFLVILVVIMVAATFYYALYSGALRWLLFAGIVAAFGFFLVRAVGGTARDPPRFVATDRATPVGGDLGRLRTTMQRAEGGLAYSQLVFEERLRKAFLEKVRVARNLTMAEVEDRARDPERLHEVLRDRDLTVFVLETDRNARLYPAALPALPKRKDFATRVARLLDRMEAWQ